MAIFVEEPEAAGVAPERTAGQGVRDVLQGRGDSPSAGGETKNVQGKHHERERLDECHGLRRGERRKEGQT